MKILFIADIHGKYENIKKVDAMMQKQNIDKLIVLGDIFGYIQEENKEIYTFLKKNKEKLIYMKGNCDNEIAELDQSENLKVIEVDNITFYLNHGHQYSYEKRQNFINKKGVLIYGHYHIPYIKKEANMVYICVGSISYPRNQNDCSYGMYQNGKFIVYDMEQNILDYIELK